MPSRPSATRFLPDFLHQRLAVPNGGQLKQVAHALNAVAANVSFVEIASDKGHDAFLLDEPELFGTVRGFKFGRRGGGDMTAAPKTWPICAPIWRPSPP